MLGVQDRLTCDGFDVWVTVDGVKAPIFNVEDTGTKRKSCWIASAAEKEFSISFCPRELEEGNFTATVKLDGHLADNVLQAYQNGKALRTTTISSSPISLTEARKFTFGSLELTDDDTLLEDPATTQNIGEIEVILQRVEMILSQHHEPFIHGSPTAIKVHERLGKGLAHQIRYGQAVEAGYIIKANRGFLVKHQGEKISFVFKYRPLEALQALGIVPPTVSPPADHTVNLRSTSPTNKPIKQEAIVVKREHSDDDGDDDESDSEEDDVEEMLAKAHALLAKIESTRSKRRAKKDAGRAKKKKVKTEPTATPVIPGEVIDLT